MVVAELEEKVGFIEGRRREKTEIGVELGEIYPEGIRSYKRKLEFEAEFRFF